MLVFSEPLAEPPAERGDPECPPDAPDVRPAGDDQGATPGLPGLKLPADASQLLPHLQQLYHMYQVWPCRACRGACVAPLHASQPMQDMLVVQSAVCLHLHRCPPPHPPRTHTATHRWSMLP